MIPRERTMFPETHESERLLFRPPRVSDAEAVFQRYSQDGEVTRFLTWAPHTSIEQTREFLAESERWWRDGTRFPWLLIDRQTDRVLGMIELRVDQGPAADGRRAEVGYVLARDAWGNGYMTEALRAVIDLALCDERLSRIWATCDVENRASARVLEKAGMVVEGRLRRHAVHPNLDSQPRDSLIYAIVRERA